MKKYTTDELKNIIEMHRKWLSNEQGGLRADLRSADLSGADLSGAYLSGAYLSGADLRSADLSGAYLRSADLRSADLRSADLRSAYLSGAYLSGADLSGADLSGAYLRSADLSGADLRSAYLSGAYLSGADLRSADLSGAYLSGVIGDMKYVKSLQCERYSITYTHGNIIIGCQTHTIEEWNEFDDSEISKMDNGALDWWRKWKPTIMNIIKLSPCEKYEEKR